MNEYGRLIFSDWRREGGEWRGEGKGGGEKRKGRGGDIPLRGPNQ